MKSRSDFETAVNTTVQEQANYDYYCISFFAGQIMAAMDHKNMPASMAAESAVKKASHLQNALNAWVEPKQTFYY